MLWLWRLLFLLSPALAGVALFLFAPEGPNLAPSQAQPPPTLPSNASIEFAGRTMGCTWRVTIPARPGDQSPVSLRREIQSVLDEADRQMSTWRTDSDLSRFNASTTTDWHPVAPELARVVSDALKLCEQTGGAFDPTVGPLVNLWGFGPEHPAGPFGTVPTDAEIAAARARVGYKMLQARLDLPALRKQRPDLYVDLSAIGKGEAVDRVARRLDALGLRDYLVTVAGENRARGISPAGRPWRIGIETPADASGKIVHTVEMSDRSIATSGGSRHFFDHQGIRYAHLIDPRTGRPLQSRLGSVTVIHPSAATASVMALALIVLGPEEGFAFAEKQKIAALFLQQEDGVIHQRMTPTFEASAGKAYNSPDGARHDQDSPLGRPD